MKKTSPNMQQAPAPPTFITHRPWPAVGQFWLFGPPSALHPISPFKPPTPNHPQRNKLKTIKNTVKGRTYIRTNEH